MTTKFDDPLYAPIVPDPIRMLVLGSAEPSWYQAPHDEQQERILPALRACFQKWQDWGAKYLGSVDDDLLMVGTPRSRLHTFYIIYEVEDLETASAMINLFRKELHGVRLNHYFRFESMLGQGFFPADEAAAALEDQA